MCGRFYVEPDDPPEVLAEILREAEERRRRAEPDFRLKREGEICPGDSAAVLAPGRAGGTGAFVMRWGFGLNGRLIFNARSESAGEKALFRESFAARRCLIPASAYFEWDHRQKPFVKHRFTAEGAEESGFFWLAGLYRLQPEGAEFTVLTREAVPEIAMFHPRMPVLLPDAVRSAWLDPQGAPHDVLRAGLGALDAGRRP